VVACLDHEYQTRPPALRASDAWAMEVHWGKNAAWCISHDPLSQAAGPAWHVVFCGHWIILISPQEGQMFRPLTVFLRTLAAPVLCPCSLHCCC
jgi:hypothetical protein